MGWRKGREENNFILGLMFIAHSSVLDFPHLPNRSTLHPFASALWVRTLNAMNNFSRPHTPRTREIRRGKHGVLAIPPAPCLWGDHLQAAFPGQLRTLLVLYTGFTTTWQYLGMESSNEELMPRFLKCRNLERNANCLKTCNYLLCPKCN